MVLLTSSQVSVAITCTIIFLFTLALFLSGYVIQQQTVRDLRAAIKPHVNQPILVSHLLVHPAKPSSKENIAEDDGDAHAEERHSRMKTMKMIDQRLFDLPPEEKTQAVGGVEEMDVDEKGDPLTRAQRRKKYKKALTAGSEEEGFKGYHRRMW
ncbi:hypothetical protein BJ878DRAFT_567702 [Calycina marina]|uniref:Uncharacterized protein n=1 Tax=Calycina marina TaxID=1763456 RepID=A0A9P7Z2X3_9HELO|nr:hypothetical protein BJ878DRAFT_567702 [Calycina marina]